MRSRTNTSEIGRLVVRAGFAALGAIVARSIAERLDRFVTARPSTKPRARPRPEPTDAATGAQPRSRHAAYSDAADRDAGDGVRPAGSEAMRDPPRRWSRADEASDESFPASDPPANY